MRDARREERNRRRSHGDSQEPILPGGGAPRDMMQKRCIFHFPGIRTCVADRLLLSRSECSAPCYLVLLAQRISPLLLSFMV